MIIALGVAWILNGLEITIASNVGPLLTQKATLNMSASAVADIATWYLIGEVIGALVFSQLSDKLGRRNLFMVTLGVYLVGSGLTAASPAGGKWFLFPCATERKPLEDIARPLSVIGKPAEAIFRTGGQPRPTRG